MSNILVIVVTFNSLEWLDRCFGSLRASTVRADVLAVDNGSTDGTVQYLKEHFPEVFIHEAGKNLGFGAANNIGLKKVLDDGYDYAYLLNSDAWLCHDTLELLIGASVKDSRFGILSPVQMSADMKSPDRNFDKWYGMKKPVDIATGICEVPFVMAAHWLVTRQAVETVGGFSPTFKLYGEDDNYIDRLHYFGLLAGVVPTAVAVHDRADRTITKAYRMNLKTVAAIVKVSDPNHRFCSRFIKEIFELLGMSVKNLSFTPLLFIPELFRRRSELLLNRNDSVKCKAFLDPDRKE